METALKSRGRASLPAVNYDEFADLYDHQYDVYRDDLHFYAGVAERTGGRILEVGAGTGRVTAFLARRGFSGTLIWPAIREMQERAGLEGAGEDPDES